MFDKLEDLLHRFEEILNELNEPTVTEDQKRFRALMKEQSDLTPLVEAYKEYKKCNETVEDSLALLDSENDEEMREMLKEELNDAKKRIEELETQMKILLLPKDPNDDKNVIVEIRAVCGGNLPYVCALRRGQTLEGGAGRVRGNRHRRYEERDIHDHRTGRLLCHEV